jgi:hypothetical protein
LLLLLRVAELGAGKKKNLATSLMRLEVLLLLLL